MMAIPNKWLVAEIIHCLRPVHELGDRQPFEVDAQFINIDHTLSHVDHLFALDNHSRSDGVVGRLVDQDKRARRSVARITIHNQRLGSFEADPAKVVHLQSSEPADELRSINVDAMLDACKPNFGALRRVFDQIFAPGIQRLFAEPANIGAEFAGYVHRGQIRHNQITARHIDVILQEERHRLRRKGLAERPVKS